MKQLLLVPITTAAVLAFVIAPLMVCADDPPTNDEPQKAIPPYLNEFRALEKEYDDKLNSVFQKMEKAFEAALAEGGVKEERLKQSLKVESDAIIAAILPNAFELVEPHAADHAADEPLAWIAQHVGGETEIGKAAIALLMEHHLTRQSTLDLAYGWQHTGGIWAERLLRAQVAAADLSEDRRPKQTLALARCLQCAAETRKGEAEKLDAEAIRLFTELGERYSDKQYGLGVTIGEIAQSSVFEIRNLRVGKTAPDIEGEDVDGVSLKLSNYRGKVVMLSFWASWCGPCMSLVPHERELVEQYQEKPFALIGVNADMDKNELRPVLESQAITWRSFWCGEKGPVGPIPRSWNVRAWPTVYLIDHVGVIRLKDAHAAELDSMIETLVAEADRAIQRD